jgi:hypothetical protein
MPHIRIRRMVVSALLALAAATLAVVAPTVASAAASTHGIAYTNGTRAAEGWFNRRNGTHGNRAWIDLYDAKCDANSVHVLYKLNGEWRTNQLTNDGGCGTTAGFNMPTGYFTIEYKVCVNDSAISDTCSNWINDHS